MDTIFLAEAFGLLFIFVGVGLQLNRRVLRQILESFYQNNALIFVAGAVGLMVGVPMILLHSKWDSTLEILVSLIGWVAAIKGLVRVMFASKIGDVAKQMATPVTVQLALTATVLYGVVLVWMGFGV